MAENPTRGYEKQESKHIALLQYIADQLRCYSDEVKAKDDVLTTFADMLDEMVSEIATIEPDYELALPLN